MAVMEMLSLILGATLTALLIVKAALEIIRIVKGNNRHSDKR